MHQLHQCVDCGAALDGSIYWCGCVSSVIASITHLHVNDSGILAKTGVREMGLMCWCQGNGPDVLVSGRWAWCAYGEWLVDWPWPMDQRWPISTTLVHIHHVYAAVEYGTHWASEQRSTVQNNPVRMLSGPVAFLVITVASLSWTSATEIVGHSIVICLGEFDIWGQWDEVSRHRLFRQLLRVSSAQWIGEETRPCCHCPVSVLRSC